MTINAGQIKEAREAGLWGVQLFLGLPQLTRVFMEVAPHLQRKHVMPLMTDFNRTTMGDTLSAGGLAGAMMHLTEDMVYQPERDYFTRLQGLLGKFRNSLCGLELDAEITTEQLVAAYDGIVPAKRRALGLVHESMKIVDNAIENLGLEPAA